jgi:hypothetical protein
MKAVMNIKFYLLLYARFSPLLVILILTGCGLPSKVTPTAVSTNTPLSTESIASVTPTVWNTATNTATVPPTETPVTTYTPTATATRKPQPTFTSKEAEEMVKDLIATNGGCLLPCWWGITPGVTTWEETRSFLEPFATRILTLRENLYGVTIDNLPESISDGGVGATIGVKDDIVQTIRTDVFYPLPQVLQIYGQPDEVRVYVDPWSIDALAPFVIALYYEKLGFLATYSGKTSKGEVIKICPSLIGEPQTIWYLWSPDLTVSFDKAGRQALLFVSPSEKPFHRLEETTNIDDKVFFEKYRDPQNTSMCFQWFDPRLKER